MTEVYDDSSDSDFFENRVFNCISFKVVKPKQEIRLMFDRKVEKTYMLSSFPKDTLTSTGTLSGMINFIRKEASSHPAKDTGKMSLSLKEAIISLEKKYSLKIKA